VPNTDDSWPASGPPLHRAFEALTNIREFRDHGLTTIQFEDVLVDLMRPVLPAFGHVLERAVKSNILGHDVPVSSAEGLIVMKLVACRPVDESDIQDPLSAYAGRLDLGFVRAELDSLMERDDPRRIKLESWISEAGGAGTSSVPTSG
jgi:hypothetical protein